MNLETKWKTPFFVVLLLLFFSSSSFQIVFSNITSFQRESFHRKIGSTMNFIGSVTFHVLQINNDVFNLYQSCTKSLYSPSPLGAWDMAVFGMSVMQKQHRSNERNKTNQEHWPKRHHKQLTNWCHCWTEKKNDKYKEQLSINEKGMTARVRWRVCVTHNSCKTLSLNVHNGAWRGVWSGHSHSNGSMCIITNALVPLPIQKQSMV